MKDSEEIRLVSLAYISLLRVSHSSYGRAANQRVYAGLRDWLALLSGEDPEFVQNAAEEMVREACK